MPVVRPVRAEDTDDVVRIVRTVFDVYGFTWEADGYCADLYDVANVYGPPDARFWVAEHEGKVVGCVGLELFDRLPGALGDTVIVDGDPRVASADCELVRLYVDPGAWGLGLGKTLTQTVLDEAAGQDKTVVELWSDKKLTHAHALYRGLGAQTVGERICPGDPDQSQEFGFALPVRTNLPCETVPFHGV